MSGAVSGAESGAAFDAAWLALREPADRRARAWPLVTTLAEALDPCPRPLRILDLGAGTGANMRALAPRLPRPQHWCLVDRDAALLARAAPEPAAVVECRRADLAGDLAPLFDPAPHLVTASALLDLCSAAWLERLVSHLARLRAPFLATLTVDGRQVWEPPHPADAAVLAAFAADQRRDKGLGGPALGPAAPDALAATLAKEGFRVLRAPSDWVLAPPRDATLIAALAEGTAAAAARHTGTALAADWVAARRRARRVVIGHADILALPPD